MGKGQYVRKARPACYPCSCGKSFKSSKCALRCEAKHEAAQAISDTEKQDETDVRLLVKSLSIRICQLEKELQKERAERKLEIAELQEMITQPKCAYRRGRYSMRPRAPACGYGSWDTDWFLGNIAPAYEWFKQRKKYPLFFSTALVFITVVLFLGNDCVNLVEFGTYPRDKNGVPLYVDLNTGPRLRRRVSTNGAVEQIFKEEFLPEWEELEKIFLEVTNGKYKPTHWQVVRFRKQYNYYKHYFTTAMGGNKTDGAWTSRWELVKALAEFEAYPISTDETEIKQAEDTQGPRFWEVLELEDLGCFNRQFRDNEVFKKLLLKRLTDRNELDQYHEEGGGSKTVPQSGGNLYEQQSATCRRLSLEYGGVHGDKRSVAVRWNICTHLGFVVESCAVRQ